MSGRGRTPTSPSPSPEPEGHQGHPSGSASSGFPGVSSASYAYSQLEGSGTAGAAGDAQPLEPHEVARQEVEAKTREVIDSLYQLAFCATDVHPGQENLVGNLINSVLGSLASLSKAGASPDLTSLIPDDVMTMIDAGRNPDIHTRSFMNRLASDNQQMASQVDNFNEYREMLAKELGESFPELREGIEEIERGNGAAVEVEPVQPAGGEDKMDT